MIFIDSKSDCGTNSTNPQRQRVGLNILKACQNKANKDILLQDITTGDNINQPSTSSGYVKYFPFSERDSGKN